MKKEYEAPVIEEIKISVQDIMGESIPPIVETPDGPYSPIG